MSKINLVTTEEIAAERTNLDSLHRELVEARNLAIKTDNLIKNLGAEIKQIAKTQEGYNKRYLLNSGVAYVLFVAIISVGLYLAFNAKISSARQEVEHYAARNLTLQDRLTEVEGELERRREAENRAYAFFELVESGNPDEVVEQFTQVQSQITDRAMIELLRDRVDEINYNLAEQAFRQGLTYSQNDNWSDARDAFLNSLHHLERTPWAPELHYSLGSVLAQLDDFEGALNYFDLALASPELDDAARADATYQRGRCLEATGRQAEALDAYRAFREAYATHRMAGRALHRINALNRTLDREPESGEDD